MSEAVASRVLEALGPALAEAAGPLLVDLVDALTAAAQDVADQVDATVEGWPTAFDLDETPTPGWLATILGADVPFGLTPDDVRAYLRDRAAWRRGTPAAMLAAARQAYPTGLIVFVERDGSPWATTLRIYSAEATSEDQARVLAAATVHKPVGIILTVELVAGASYLHLQGEAATYDALRALYPTYHEMRAHVPEEGTVP